MPAHHSIMESACPCVRRKVATFWLACGIALAGLVSARPAFAQKLQLEIEPEWKGSALVLGKEIPGGKVEGMSISRLDGLLSQLALQRADKGPCKESRGARGLCGEYARPGHARRHE